jgi:hypothetical protein
MKTKNIQLHIPSPRNFSISKYALLLLLLCVLFTTAKAQVVAPIKDTIPTQKEEFEYFVKGKLVSINNIPLPSLSIRIKKTCFIEMTDSMGNFKIKIDDVYYTKHLDFIVAKATTQYKTMGLETIKANKNYTNVVTTREAPQCIISTTKCYRLDAFHDRDYKKEGPKKQVGWTTTWNRILYKDFFK